MWLSISIILCIITIILFVLLYYSLKRIGQYEQFLVNIEKVINYSSERLKQLDSKGTFEADDEVGFFFEEVKKMKEMMDDIFENTNEQGEQKND